MSLEKVIVAIIAALFQSLAATVINFKQIDNVSLNKKIEFFILMFIYCTIGYFFVPNQFRLITFITVTAIIIYITLGISDRRLLLYSFNIEVIVSVSEIFISIILVLVGFNSVDIVNNPLYNLLTNILISLFVILLINIKPIQKLLNKTTNLFATNKTLMKYI